MITKSASSYFMFRSLEQNSVPFNISFVKYLIVGKLSTTSDFTPDIY